MSDVTPEPLCPRLEMIPESVWHRIEEFSTQVKTGQITLNFLHGRIKNYDVREHGEVRTENLLDK